MKFKPGDVFVWNENYKAVYLVLKINREEQGYDVFVLSHIKQDWLGHKLVVSFDEYFTDLTKINLYEA